MISKNDDKKIKELMDAILCLKTPNEVWRFLRDLLTEAELIEAGRRWKAARMLETKNLYTEIEKETKLSSTTVARVSKWLNNGKNGYKLVLKRIGNKQHHNLSSLRKGLR
jgi:TrpR-related protein YerC/YecD